MELLSREECNQGGMQSRRDAIKERGNNKNCNQGRAAIMGGMQSSRNAIKGVECNQGGMQSTRNAIKRGMHSSSGWAPVEDEIAAKVLPQKLLSANRMTAWFLGTPFTSYPHRLQCCTAKMQAVLQHSAILCVYIYEH